jgi:UDPglucose--hexose-1-phosphate uridylyltransferase
MPELRRDPVVGRWVLVASDHVRRPSDFVRQPVPAPSAPKICPYCPGHERKTPPEVLSYRDTGGANEPGWSVRVTPHKLPALGIEGELNRQGEGMFDKMNGVGAHEVIVESPDHSATMACMPERQVAQALGAVRDRILDLKRDTRFRYMLFFKNHGERAGASIDHTHSQLIALPVVPANVVEEMEGAKRYFEYRERCIFCDLLRQDAASGLRLVLETERFAVLTPYASRFPFEISILPKRHESHFESIDEGALQNLGWVLRTVLRKLDRALERPPYNLMLHTAPVQDAPIGHYHWRLEIIPRLTEVAGFEWGAGFYMNPTPPEEAARFLREAGWG